MRVKTNLKPSFGICPNLRKTRGISEAVSAMVLLTVIATVSIYAMSNSTKNTTEHGLSISDVMEQKGMRTQELLSVISKNVSQDKIVLEVINYGTKEFLINKIFVDGNESAFTVLSAEGTHIENRTLMPRQILSLHVPQSGQTLQILTDSGNIFNFDLGF
ncbi:hypothetical protein [Candidatus Nitrosotenuis uzonensis]|uniref:Flagellin n=1 Tax=Candidatus Nitrosotenuis uzonensis TaxID=1407055 RepID=V6AQX4_9ARCH|nr:hypothetical protein [Candidatus Nitrosotenuis uzonensis]CDI05042.1 exported hypothetical protein [Candidatus Nitrosotenuis uzonensis]